MSVLAINESSIKSFKNSIKRVNVHPLPRNVYPNIIIKNLKRKRLIDKIVANNHKFMTTR